MQYQRYIQKRLRLGSQSFFDNVAASWTDAPRRGTYVLQFARCHYRNVKASKVLFRAFSSIKTSEAIRYKTPKNSVLSRYVAVKSSELLILLRKLGKIAANLLRRFRHFDILEDS